MVGGAAVLGAACLVVGLVLLLVPPAAPVAAAAGVVPDVSVPGPGAAGALPVAGTVPVRLELPGRGVTAPVVAVPTGPDGGLVIPDPPSTVGWWSPSALPGGTGGTTVIVGHVDSRRFGLGALAVLRSIEVGEAVLLHGADGRDVGYRVVARRQYRKADLPREIFAVGGPPQLVLITCGGRFDRSTRQYADNVVVHAVPV